MTLTDAKLAGTEVRLCADKATVAAAAVDLVLDAARDAIAERGGFRVCLAGGTTPEAAYRMLAASEADWASWHVYHGDERCVGPDDPARNSLAASKVWLDHVPIPAAQQHAIPAELGAERGAEAYATTLASALPFDLVLLGIGEDGHTASLFPGRAAPVDRLTMPVHDSPKPPPDRVSLTPKALTACRQLVVLATGAGKADALRRWRAGEHLPVADVAAAAPNALVLADRDAWGA